MLGRYIHFESCPPWELKQMGLSLTMKLNKTSKQSGREGVEVIKPRHVQNKQELYGDAYLSFDFALRNGIFMESPILTNTTKSALEEWLQLLRRALPPVWKIQRTIDAILNDFDTNTANETIFLETIEPFKPNHKDWSPACTHENGLPGYTCGLWELFHIMTVGVMEWNKQGDNKWVVISTEHAAKYTARLYRSLFRMPSVSRKLFKSIRFVFI